GSPIGQLQQRSGNLASASAPKTAGGEAIERRATRPPNARSDGAGRLRARMLTPRANSSERIDFGEIPSRAATFAVLSLARAWMRDATSDGFRACPLISKHPHTVTNNAKHKFDTKTPSR